MKIINFKAFKRIFRPLGKIDLDGQKNRYKLEESQSFFGDEEPFSVSVTPVRAVVSGIIVLFAMLLQEGIFNDLRFFGVKPKLALVCVILFSMNGSTLYSLCLGALSGLFVDIVYGRTLGFYGLVFMYVAFFANVIVSRRVKGKNIYYILVSPLFLFIMNFFIAFASKILLSYLGSALSLDSFLPGVIFSRVLPETLYEFVIFVLLTSPITGLWKLAGGHFEVRSFFGKGGKANG